MNKYFLWIASIICFQTTTAQVSDPNQVAKDAATNHVNNDMGNAADNGLNKAENSIKGLFKKKNKAPKADSSQSAYKAHAPATSGQDTPTGQPASLGLYANYDFVPGDKIIFQSQLQDEQTGQIPSQFMVSNGCSVSK